MEFQQSSYQWLYSAVYDEPAPAPTPTGIVPQLWFLLPSNVTPPAGPISLTDSWQNPAYSAGWYIFLDAPVSESAESTFGPAAQTYLSTYAPGGTRFAWIENPTSQQLTGFTIQVSQTPESPTGTISQPARLGFGYGDLILLILRGCTVQVDPSGAGFSITQVGGNPDSIQLVARGTSLPLASSLTLALSGALSGCLAFAFTLEESSDPTGLDLMDVSARYFYPTRSSDAADGSVSLTSLQYPIFAEQTVQLYVNFDPLNLQAPNQDPTRTFFAFNAEDAGLPSASASSLLSNYSSTLGDPFALLPLTGSAAPTAFSRLVLAQNQDSIPPGTLSTFYLTPMGDFALQLPAADSQGRLGLQPATPVNQRLMCGLSGIEYIGPQVEGATLANYVLSFFPGQSAYAPSFSPSSSGVTAGRNLLPDEPSVAGNAAITGSGPTLPTTSWACVSARQQPVYYAQPDTSILHQSPAQSVSGDATWQPLVYLEVPANTLQATLGASQSFPLLPYEGVAASDLTPYGELEAQVIAPQRRSIIAGPSAPPRERAGAVPAGSLVAGTTPQGLLGHFTSDMKEWNDLILAQMPGGQQLALQGIPSGSALWNALLNNQVFLVISDPSSIAPYLQPQNALVTMQDGWTFDLEPKEWQDTILIFKFRQETLLDCAGAVSLWTMANDFNGGQPTSTSTALTTILQDAIKHANNQSDPRHEYYAYLAQIAQDPNWHGILVFNAKVSAFPAQISGIAAGLDMSRLYAHHVGINASAVDPTTMTITNSSLFGLIDYGTSGALVPNNQPYQFLVESLQVLFANSSPSIFSSQIELGISQMFGETVKPLQGNWVNAVQFQGVMQTQTLPDGTQVDSYFFQTAQNSMVELDMQSAVLNSVDIIKGQFITVASGTGAQSGNTLTHNRFTFWGVLDFVALEGFDLLSYGRESGGSTQGLSFSNLAIDMSFNPAQSGSTTWQFDAGQLTLDLAGSTARQASLAAHFPLALTGFTQAKSGTAPTDGGYMGVQSPLNQSALQYPWYSLNFDLNLGSVGALASQAGFVAGLIVAWSPSNQGYRVFTGLKLPGSNGGKREIDLEGVLKITFKTLEFLTPTQTKQPAYALILYNIALSFLSKSFPSSGQINFVLFGNPESVTNSSLGWYLAYAKSKAQLPAGQRRLLAGPSRAQLPDRR